MTSRRGQKKLLIRFRFLFQGRLDSKILYKEEDKCAGQTLTEYAIEEQADFMIIGMSSGKNRAE